MVETVVRVVIVKRTKRQAKSSFFIVTTCVLADVSNAHGWCIVVPINKILLSKQHFALEQAGKKKL